MTILLQNSVENCPICGMILADAGDGTKLCHRAHFEMKSHFTPNGFRMIHASFIWRIGDRQYKFHYPEEGKEMCVQVDYQPLLHLEKKKAANNITNLNFRNPQQIAETMSQLIHLATC